MAELSDERHLWLDRIKHKPKLTRTEYTSSFCTKTRILERILCMLILPPKMRMELKDFYRLSNILLCFTNDVNFLL